MKLYKHVSFVLFCLTALSCRAQVNGLQAGFRQMPDSVKPAVYWYWLNNNISKEGVRKDLQAMADVGIGRAFIGNIGLEKEQLAYGHVPVLSPEWYDITREAIKAGGDYGVNIGLFNSPGWSMSGGPWVGIGQSMRYLASEELTVTRPGLTAIQLPGPHGVDFPTVRVLAFPASKEKTPSDWLRPKKVDANFSLTQADNWFDADTATVVPLPARPASQPWEIDFEFDQVQTIRSLVLYPASRSIQADVELLIKEADGYRSVRSFKLDRNNVSNIVGFLPYGPVAVSFPAEKGDRFRIKISSLKGSKEGIADIRFSSVPLLERYVEKQLGKMFQEPLPLWEEYQWKTQAEPGRDLILADPSRILDITRQLGKDGKLNWKVPAGKWTIIRFFMKPTGVVNAPAAEEGRGLELDKINAKAVDAHYDAFIGKIVKSMTPHERRALKYVVGDSYETGSQNWTDSLETAFRKRYNYDPIPWLPVLTGRIVRSADQSDRFLWDLRRLVADKVAGDYVRRLRERSNQDGMKLWLENYGHWGFPAEFLQYGGQSDEVAGEFWNERDLGSVELKAASSAAHIYGKGKVSAESFTSSGAGLVYARYPLLLKAKADWSFTEGINNTLLHVYIHQPDTTTYPGINAWFGTEFNRKNTWFYKGRSFVDYIRRCNYMLQQGHPVIDVAYFIGEDAPKMTGTRQPALPEGFQFDYINAEVIETRLTVKDGYLVLPDGMRYRVLVLPPLQTMRPALLRKIRQLVEAGAVVVGPPPQRSPSMENYPAADKEVSRLAAEMWTSEASKGKGRSLGRGKLFYSDDLQTVFGQIGLSPDMKLNKKDSLLFAHRISGGTDIYFISNQSYSTVSASPSFRVTGKKPYWFDPVTGISRPLPEYIENGPYTTSPLVLAALQSGFVVFDKNAPEARQEAAGNFPSPVSLPVALQPWTLDISNKNLVLDSLIDWSQSADETVKYFSGTAVYKNRFELSLPATPERVLLNLGKLSAMAEVFVNGKSAGTVWTAPWQVDITDLLQPGENNLRIEVVNTWVNRMIGESRLPASERSTWMNYNQYKPGSPLQSSGLLGPVQFLTVKYAQGQ